jgi:hypothetical protein
VALSTDQREPVPAPEDIPAADPAAEDRAALTPLFERWSASIRNLAHRWLTIAALEARVAALNISLMLMLAVASGLLLASAWIALFAAIIAGLHALGLAWHFALLLVALVNLALAIAGFHYINRMSNHLIFNTLRALVAEPEQSDADNRAGPAAGNTTPAKTD